MVRNSYQGFGSEYETLLNAFDKDIASLKKRVGKDRVASTLWAMQRSRKDVADFLQSNLRRTDISMLELVPEFIKDFAALPISARTEDWQTEPSGNAACG